MRSRAPQFWRSSPSSLRLVRTAAARNEPEEWRETVNVLTRFAMPLMLLAVVAACSPMIEATETERELCIAWRDSLPSRSHADTDQTQDEIGVAYDVQAAACPRYSRF